jgi:hypothetical protein
VIRGPLQRLAETLKAERDHSVAARLREQGSERNSADSTRDCGFAGKYGPIIAIEVLAWDGGCFSNGSWLGP